MGDRTGLRRPRRASDRRWSQRRTAQPGLRSRGAHRPAQIVAHVRDDRPASTSRAGQRT